MTKAIFLDRDGVINRELNDWVKRVEDVEMLDGVYDVLSELQKKGHLFIIITNQSGIDLGLYSYEILEKINNFIAGKLSEHGISIAEIYYCPHHPTVGKCICRKPDSLLLEKAIARFNIDVSKSYLIGDRERDIQAAEKVGLKGILMESNTSLYRILPKID
ncbi:MAG: HAD family hydrolase [Bacteroidetes bacterium]|nr:HAD family hydrolase [Bacteroidota bacterium]